MHAPNPAEPFVLGVTGMSGSGKTWLVNQLQQKLGGKLSVLRFDDYYRPFHEQKSDANGYTNFDLPEALNHRQFYEDLLKLIEGHEVLVKEYPFELENPEITVRIVSPAPIVIADGLFLQYHRHIDSLFNARILVDADAEITLQRRLERDASERGIAREKSLYQWYNHVLPSYEQFIYPFKNECNLIINNHDAIETQLQQVLSLIFKMAEPHIREHLSSI